MRQLYHHISLVMFTLFLPGVVISYVIFFQPEPLSLLRYFVTAIVIMGIGSLHLKKPIKTPLLMQNIKSSWFSREAVFYLLFIIGLLLQVIFSSLRSDFLRYLIFIFGSFGIVSTIFIYNMSHLRRKWPVLIDILIEAFFFAYILWIFNQDRIFQKIEFSAFLNCLNLRLILLIIGTKLIKDSFLIVKGFWQEKDGYWVLPGLIHVIIIIVIVSIPEYYLIYSILMGINSIFLRLKFFIIINQDYLDSLSSELRKNYLPEKYNNFFR